MRTISLTVAALAALCTTAAAHHEDDEHDEASCTLSLRLVDAKTQKETAGLVSIRGADGQRLALQELQARGVGVSPMMAIQDWFVVPGPCKVRVPREKLQLRAFSGLATELAQLSLDCRGKSELELTVPLRRFYDAHANNLQSANTHVHLRRMSLPQSDRYLVEVARGDALDVVFVSYLERAVDDLEYTTNKYTLKDFQRLSNAHVHFDNGEEHRHNFTAFEEGYGHVMLLHIPELILPVSIGPGIMKQGTDGIPLRRGIEQARDFGSTVIWCHNQWGLEDIPNWLEGKLHANNIFDGGTHGSYRHSFYRYLNAGIRVPFSTGTDWFVYDFSRVYVPTDGAGQGGGAEARAKRRAGQGGAENKDADDRWQAKRLTPEQWLAQLAAGRSYITNGPLLEFDVAGRGIGDTVELAQPGEVRVKGRALGRVDFNRIELIRDGVVVGRAATRREGGHFVAELDVPLAIDRPCWLALRTPPPSSSRDPEFETTTPLNEYGRELFSHTSAVYVNVAGKAVFHQNAARDLLEEMRKSRTFIAGRGVFADDEERQRVLQVYDRAIAKLAGRLEQ